jgi:branched-chain amino acid transport system substrate-binding protein
MGPKVQKVLLILVILVLAACQKQPVKIGFIGCITGKGSDLGLSAKNGILLARDFLNTRGGINGHDIEIIIRDNGMDPGRTVEAVRELSSEGVAAIIGPLTSTAAMAAVGEAEKRKILLISPSATTDALTGVDDWFYRIQPPNSYETRNIAAYIMKSVRPKRIAAFIDLSNSSYTVNWYESFKRDLSFYREVTLIPMRFDSRDEISYYSMVRGLEIEKPDCVVLIVNGLDAALLCQQMEKMKMNIPVISCIWAKTKEFIYHAGTSGEGVIFFQHYDEENSDPAYLRFRELYRDRYRSSPDYAAHSAFEALMVIQQALSSDPDVRHLKETMVRIKEFQGLQGSISFSPQGDPLYNASPEKKLVVVKNGTFVTIGALKSEGKQP